MFVVTSLFGGKSVADAGFLRSGYHTKGGDSNLLFSPKTGRGHAVLVLSFPLVSVNVNYMDECMNTESFEDFSNFQLQHIYHVPIQMQKV